MCQVVFIFFRVLRFATSFLRLTLPKDKIKYVENSSIKKSWNNLIRPTWVWKRSSCCFLQLPCLSLWPDRTHPHFYRPSLHLLFMQTQTHFFSAFNENGNITYKLSSCLTSTLNSKKKHRFNYCWTDMWTRKGLLIGINKDARIWRSHAACIRE